MTNKMHGHILFSRGRSGDFILGEEGLPGWEAT